MCSYTTRYINTISLIITIIVFTTINYSSITFKNINFGPKKILSVFRKDKVQVEFNSNNINQNTEEKKETENIYPYLKSEEKIEKLNWQITIPCISLKATISEGTSTEVMNKYVGHFDETSKATGNIGLAAHNRGYDVNYFSDIKKLKQGDEIIYQYYEFQKTYIVEKNVIIKDTDWTYLEKTKENKITLITCVENEPEYRRCIQGIEKTT